MMVQQEFQHAPNPHVSAPLSVLSKYYRIPGPHVMLATKGAYFPARAIEMTATGDVPVFPMKASDEMLLQSPDALLSGLALEKLFESCVPAIKTPRLISTPDIDILLLAIRVATYGNKMDLEVRCPKCKHENSFDCDLPSLLATIRYTDTDGSVRLSDDVIAYVRPYNLDNATKLALVSYEETRRLQALEVTEMDGKMRATEVNRTMKIISHATKAITADCVYKIVVPEGTVTNKDEILEFISNVPKPWVEKIDEKIKALNDSGIDKTIHAHCEECKHEWDTEVEFDPANFFEGQSSVSQTQKV
jgi:phage FluMu protein Com